MATFTNQATLSFNDVIINSNVVTGEITDPVTVTKTAGAAEYNRTDTVPYYISIVNSGSGVYSGLTVTDYLGAYTVGSTPATTFVPLDYVAGSVCVFINGVLQPTPTISDIRPLTLSGLSLPAGGNVIIAYSARPNQYAPLGANGTIENTVSLDGTGFVEPITARDSLRAAIGASISITKSLEPLTSRPDGDVTYTFVITNTGATPVTASDFAVITDRFNPIITISDVTFNGTLWTPTTEYTYDHTSGVFRTVQGAVTIPAATFTQDPANGQWYTNPGTSTLVITGTI